MADSDGFSRGEILDLIFENYLGENLNKTFDGEFGSSFSEVRKESFNLIILYLQKKHVQRIIF